MRIQSFKESVSVVIWNVLEARVKETVVRFCPLSGKERKFLASTFCALTQRTCRRKSEKQNNTVQQFPV